MRVTNRHVANQGNKMNGNKRIKVVKDNLPASQNKQWAKATFKHQATSNLSPQIEEYDEAHLYSDINDDASDTEPEQIEEQKRAFMSVASKVRPLLQLFADSEDSKLVVPKTIPPGMTTVQQPILYKDISLCSEEENENPSEFQEDQMEFIDSKVTAHKLNSKRFEWTPKSTNAFLDLWEKNVEGIRGKRKNSLIHKEMAQEMREYGPTHREIKAKMDNMIRKHRTEAEKIKLGKRTNWRYYKRVKSLLTEPLPSSSDFEEILIDSNELSTFLNSDNSDVDSNYNDMSEEEDIPNGSIKRKEVEQFEDIQEMYKKEKPPQKVIEKPQKGEHQIETKTETSISTTDRMLQIEQEKLQVEKQKLQVMKHISRDLLSISKTLVELLRNTKK
ncbi:uncharacterized protein LOC117787240 [Drosophila innubila]|uniref:uncharacterized protein LOC117787240 n=1 Tax=Drosophila innubila TaxID=198719 RepID=UPI00148DCE3D|nr:uncharacterized protein LOC117787240 [Drosophila innubila]